MLNVKALRALADRWNATSDVDFYFQPGKIEIYRELFEFSAAEGTRKGGELVPSRHRVFARAAGKCKKEKRGKHKFESPLSTMLDSEKTHFNFRYRDTSVGRRNLRS